MNLKRAKNVFEKKKNALKCYTELLFKYRND